MICSIKAVLFFGDCPKSDGPKNTAIKRMHERYDIVEFQRGFRNGGLFYNVCSFFDKDFSLLIRFSYCESGGRL